MTMHSHLRSKVPLIACFDSSILLRVILGQPGRIPEWESITLGVASGLVEVECLRTIDRLHLAGPGGH